MATKILVGVCVALAVFAGYFAYEVYHINRNLRMDLQVMSGHLNLLQELMDAQSEELERLRVERASMQAALTSAEDQVQSTTGALTDCEANTLGLLNQIARLEADRQTLEAEIVELTEAMEGKPGLGPEG